MADNLTTATIDVRANTRGLEKDILKALQTVELSQINTKKSSQALGRITGQVSEFNKSLEASNARVIAFGASAGAIFAVEKAFTSLITSTIEVEKKLTDINVLLGLSSSSLEKFGNSLFDVARNTAQSFSDVADAATELARQGLGIEETLKRTNAALILTRLSGLDAKSSVEALTATLNSFSGSALDAVEVVNKLANVDAAFAVSSADLANAISRVGSTAVDAGVSLDELIALVTSAQQTTARGGAVIGNSFKTIFTRLQRGKVQDLLGSLGVDTSEGQSAISLLQQLATTYDQLGSVQKSYIAEQVGGVFQINILKAALSDLGKEYSIYGRALDTSLSSTDQAIKRNELLNQTVSALSSQAVANLEQAANKIGSIVFEPNAKGFLKGFNDILSSFNNIDAESAGGKLMTGFFKGIGDFIGGPGAVLATAVLVKLFARLTQFAAGSAKELLGTNKAAQQQQAIEQSILAILQKNSQFTNQILTGKISTIEAEKKMLDYLSAQSNILREQERLSKVIGSNLAKKGVTIGASGIPMTAPSKKTGAAASGYIPNFAMDMAVGQAMENAGAKQHGYKAGKAKKTTIHDGNGKSFKSFVNSREEVKTFTNADGKKATIVRPPNGFGENTQYAAGGYIPNFVKNQTSIRAGVDFEKRLNKSLKGAESFSPNAPMDFPLPEGYGTNNKVKSALGISSNSIYGDAKISRSRKSEQSLLDKYLRTPEGQKDFLSSKETTKGFVNLNPKGLSMLFSQSGADAKGIAYISTLNKSLSAGAQNLIKTKFGKSKKSRTLAMPYIADKININALQALSSGYVPNFASMGSKFKAMYGGGTTMRTVDKEKTAKKKNLDVKKLDLSREYTMVHGGNNGLDPADVSIEVGNKLFDAKIQTAGLDLSGTSLQRYGIKGVVGDALVGATNNIIKTFGGKEQITDASSLDNAGSVGSAAGTVFETALRKAFNAPATSQTQRIDFPAPTPELKKFFHNAPGQYEAKISRTPDNLKSALKKWVAVKGLASSASGYVPNFAKSGLSFSHKDKDEFGFSEIQAIMSGKKVGSFSYAEDKKGQIDVGDFLVNKGERGKGIGTELYKEAIRRNAGKKMKGQLLPQMNRLLQKIKNGEPVSAETLYPQIKRADLAKSSVFEVYGHKGMTVEKMTRDQFSSFVNAKINELKKDPKKLQSFFGNVEADEYGGLGVDLQTQHASGFVPNFSNALNDAIAREKSSGLSQSQIYVDSHNSLKNKNNPMGLMVANTRDEPNGGIQGIKRAKKEGRDPKTYGAAAGFVPNFATAPIKMSPDLVDAMNAALKSVNSTLTKTPAVVNKFNEEVSDSSKKRSAGSKVGGFFKDNAIGVGFGFQSLASIAGEFAGNGDTKAGRVTKAAAGGIGDIASFAGTGAMIGGPKLAIAGGLIGLGKAAIDVTKALNTNVPELEKSLQATSDSMNRFSESGQKLLTLNEQYSDALTSGNPAQAADVMIKTQQAYAEELSKLTDVQRSSMISAIAQGKGQEQYAKILSEMQDSVKAQETVTQLTKFSESDYPFFGPDKKLLAGMDKSLALDFTKGMDTSAITAALEKTAASLSDQSRGTENQALDLMKNLAGSESLTMDQRENLNKMIEAFAEAAGNTDLSEVSEAFIKNIKGRPALDAELKKAQDAARADAEARAAKTKKEIEIREKTNAMLIKLQSDTEAIYQRYNNSMEDFISSIQTASEMMNAAGQFREEYLVQSGANKNITDPIKERNIVQKSNADLKAGIYKSQLETSNSFKNGVDSLLSGIEADSAKAGVGKSASDQSNQLLNIKSALTQALLPVQEMITSGNFEGAKAKTRDVFNQLKPEERSALGEDKIADAVKQLESGIDSGARSQDLLVKNSQKDLAIQAQQLIFQKATSRLIQAQNFGGTANQILGDTEDSPFNKAIEAVTNAKIMGYNQKGLQPGSVSAVEGGDRNSLGVDGKKPDIGTAEQIVNFYKAASEIGGESVMSTESKDFAVLTQAIREQTRKKLDELRSAGEGVVDPAVFTRLETTLAKLGGGDKAAQLKIMKELGFANISGAKIIDEALKGYSGGAFAGLNPDLKKGFEESSDEGAKATLLLLADQKNQTDSLNKGLENVVGTGLETNTLLSQQPSAIAAAIGAILEKGRAEQKLTEEGNKAKDLNAEFVNTSKKITENSNLIKEAEEKRAEAQAKLKDTGFSEADLKNEEKLKNAKSFFQGRNRDQYIEEEVARMKRNMEIPKGANISTKNLTEARKQYAAQQWDRQAEPLQNFINAVEDYNVIQSQSEIIKKKQLENEGLGKRQQETTTKMRESEKRVQVAQEQLFEKTIQANIKKTQILPAGGDGGRAYIEANKAEREQAQAKNLAMQGNGVLTEQQKKSRARSQGGGLNPSEFTYDVNANQRNTYEVAAMNQFGKGSQKAFDSLMQQQVLPSFENFSKIYENLGGKGKGKEFYQQTRATLLGLEPTIDASKKNILANQPAAAANIQPNATKSTNPPVAYEKNAFANSGNLLKASASVTPAAEIAPSAGNSPKWFQEAYNRKPGSLGGPSKDLIVSRLGPSENSPKWFQEAYNRKPGSLGGPSKDLTVSRLGPSENSPKWFQEAYNRKPGSLGGPSKDLTVSRLGPSENSPKWFQEAYNRKPGSLAGGTKDLRVSRLNPPDGYGAGSGVKISASGVGSTTSPVETQPQVKNQQEQNKVQTNTQENTNQIISNILQVVQKIATDFEQKAAGTQPGQTTGGGGDGSNVGGISVSAPVSFSINTNNETGAPQTKDSAEKIKTDLASFLSSPEFIDRVTSIAKQATGEKQPPKQLS